jgi:hypothetical protein
LSRNLIVERPLFTQSITNFYLPPIIVFIFFVGTQNNVNI